MGAAMSDELLTKRKWYREPNYVWCDQHGEIHEATMSPYGPDDRCDREYRSREHPHRRVAIERLKGDYPHEP